MTQDAYMIWRFKTEMGIMDHIKSINVFETVYDNGSKITFDYTNEFVVIDNKNSIFGKEVRLTFKECTREKLFSLGFKERSYNRHLQSYDRYTGKFKD